MATDAPTLTVTEREPAGTRANKRLRRTGQVPGVLYGRGAEPVHLTVNARDLRLALQNAGAVIDLAMDDRSTPVMLKDIQRDAVRGDAVHVDFLRVDMDQPVQAPVVVELVGVDDAPGTSEGGVLEQQTRELTVEALPGDIPETVQFDASGLEAGATVTLADLTPPRGVTFVDDPETVVASITLPRIEVETPDAVDSETEVVGDGEGEAFAPEGSDVPTQPETPGAGSGEPGAADTTAE